MTTENQTTPTPTPTPTVMTEEQMAKASVQTGDTATIAPPKKTAPKAQVVKQAAPAKTPAAPVQKARVQANEPTPQAPAALFKLGKIPPNVRGFRGYAKAQLEALEKANPDGFTMNAFRKALVNNLAKADAPGVPTVGWDKHNFPTWCPANLWVVPAGKK